MIDVHCHIQTKFKDFDLNLNDENIQRINNILLNCKQNEVHSILNVFEINNTEEINWLDWLNDQKNKPINVCFSAGAHPCYIKNISIDNTRNKLENIANKLVSFGETGIDLFKTDISLNTQIEFMRMHAELCQKYNKPLVIHARECPIENILDNLSDFNIKVMFHCWNYNILDLKKVLDKNYFISIGGLVTFEKNVQNIVESAKYCPIENLFIETDSPFLAPNPYRGKENSPVFIPLIYKYICNLRQENFQDFKLNIQNNFKLFFNV